MLRTIRKFFSNMAVATESLSKIAASISVLESKPQRTTANICSHCMTIHGIATRIPRASGLGECGKCGKIGDVYDLELLGLYQGMGISEKDIVKHLPRLRQPYAKDIIISSHTIGAHLLAMSESRKLGQARSAAHAALDQIWENGFMTRNQAYQWLATALGISRDECHISRFNVATCWRAVDICHKHYKQLTTKLKSIALSTHSEDYDDRLLPPAEPDNPWIPDATGDPDSDDTGQRFLHWLSDGLRTGKHQVNTPNAFLHTVKEGVLLVSPRGFKMYSPDNWEYVQKRFNKLGLHRKAPGNSNIWLYNVRGEKKSGVVRGFLLANPLETLGVSYLPTPNKSLFLSQASPTLENPVVKSVDVETTISLDSKTEREIKHSITTDTKMDENTPSSEIGVNPILEVRTAEEVVIVEMPEPLQSTATVDWSDGFTPWLRQQMLDNNCPPGVVNVGNDKLLVGSTAFASYCKHSGKNAALWGVISKKFRKSLGINNTTKYMRTGQSVNKKQPPNITGILVPFPGKTLNLPQSAIPQQSNYVSSEIKAVTKPKVSTKIKTATKSKTRIKAKVKHNGN